jgi:hypothetical protein
MVCRRAPRSLSSEPFAEDRFAACAAPAVGKWWSIAEPALLRRLCYGDLCQQGCSFQEIEKALPATGRLFVLVHDVGADK